MFRRVLKWLQWLLVALAVYGVTGVALEAFGQETITVPCSRVDDFLRGDIDVPPGAQVVAKAYTLAAVVKGLGAERFARLQRTPAGRAALLQAFGPLITEEE